MRDSKVHLGLIGAGRWGANYVPTIAESRSIELAWIAEPNSNAVRNTGFSGPVFDDWRRAVELSETDGVIIATPPRSHAKIALAAIELGIPVVIEKPLTTSIPEADTILATADSKSVYVAVGHVHLFSPAYKRLKELVFARGPIQRIFSHGGRWGPFREDVSALWDWGPHDIALAIDMMGEFPTSIRCQNLLRANVKEGVGENTAIHLTFSNGGAAHIRIGNLFESKKRQFKVEFENEYLCLDDTRDRKLWQGSLSVVSPQNETPIETDNTPPLSIAIRSFADAIRRKSTDLSQLQLGVNVVHVLAECENQLTQ